MKLSDNSRNNLGVLYRAALLYLLLLGLVAVGLTGYWLLEPYNTPVVYLDGRLSNTHGERATVFRPGDAIYVYRKWKQKRQAQTTVLRSIVSKSTEVAVVPEHANFAFWGQGTHERTITLVIPAHTVPGRYAYRTRVVFPLNPLREPLMITAPDLEFTVVSGEARR